MNELPPPLPEETLLYEDYNTGMCVYAYTERQMQDMHDAYSHSQQQFVDAAAALQTECAALRVNEINLTAQVEALRNDIHSCHAGCTKAGCVNERLRAEITRLQESLDTCGGTVTMLKDQVRTLRAEIEALRKDAERYRWLRDKAMGDEGNPFICVLTDGYTGQLDGESADDAINDAMGEKHE
jgi:outer membrane murein-binding lipoprotein Lpp